MSMIYTVYYSYDGEPNCENFAKLKDARGRLKELQAEQGPESKVRWLELQRMKILRPSLLTILRILNGEPYVVNRKVVVKC